MASLDEALRPRPGKTQEEPQRVDIFQSGALTQPPDSGIFEHTEFFIPVANAECPSNRDRSFSRQLHLAVLKVPSPTWESLPEQGTVATRDIIAFPGTYHITLLWLLKMFLSFSTLVVITLVNSKLINRNSKSPLDLDEQNKRDVAGLTNLFAVLLAIFVIWQIAAGLWTRNYVAAFMLGTEHAYSSRTLTRTKFVWIWLVSGVLMLALAAIAGLVVVSLSLGSLLQLLAALSAAGIAMSIALTFFALLKKFEDHFGLRQDRFEKPFRATVQAQKAPWLESVPLTLALNASLAQIVVGFVCLMYFCGNGSSKNALLAKRSSFHLCDVAFAPHGLELIAFVPHWFGVTLPRMRWLWLIYIVVFIWLPSKTSQLTEDGSIQSIFDDVSHLTADLGITTVIWNTIVFGFIVSSVAAFEATVVSTPRVIFSAYIIDVFSYFERLRDVCTFKFDRSGLTEWDLRDLIECATDSKSRLRNQRSSRFQFWRVSDGFAVIDSSFDDSHAAVNIFHFEVDRGDKDVYVTWVGSVEDDGKLARQNPVGHRGRCKLQEFAHKLNKHRPWSTAFKPDENRISPLQQASNNWYELSRDLLAFRKWHGRILPLVVPVHCDLDSVVSEYGWRLDTATATTKNYSKTHADGSIVQCSVIEKEHTIELAMHAVDDNKWREAFVDLQSIITHVFICMPSRRPTMNLAK